MKLKILKQIFIILTFYILGQALAILFEYIIPSFHIPGTIIGLILLVIALLKKWVPINEVEETGTFLTNNMGFFFIPVSVSVIEYFGLIDHQIANILGLMVISVLISFFAILYSVKLTLKIKEKKKSKGVIENE